MKILKYSLLIAISIFLLCLFYNTIMSNRCLEKCGKNPDCWEENYCGI